MDQREKLDALGRWLVLFASPHCRRSIQHEDPKGRYRGGPADWVRHGTVICETQSAKPLVWLAEPAYFPCFLFFLLLCYLLLAFAVWPFIDNRGVTIQFWSTTYKLR